MHDMSEPMANSLARALSPLFWVVVWSSGGGCLAQAEPEVSGKAVVTRAGEELVIDTGGNGTKLVGLDDDPTGLCVVRNSGGLSVVVEKGDDARLSFINVMDGGGLPHVSATIDGDLYQGPCEIIVQEQPTDPYEADVSAGPCDIIRLFDGATARVETAVFHVSDCSGAD
ncbi:hypothetical protein WME79_37325 [Sorangium sp. So ce726]|uniref:hypothetical protein n=2 Tax=unclassified Sorangium TaxID=2621164 RepID=UPI003F61343B